MSAITGSGSGSAWQVSHVAGFGAPGMLCAPHIALRPAGLGVNVRSRIVV